MTLLLVILLLPLLWLWGIRPRRRARRLPCGRYAHRGLYGGGVPENSLPAFRRAAEMGIGIELDVQLTKDGRVAVFHDAGLRRVCGVDGRLCDRTLAELRRLTLCGSAEHIPTLDEVLETVGGRVPLLVELKKGPHGAELCRRTLALLRDSGYAFSV